MTTRRRFLQTSAAALAASIALPALARSGAAVEPAAITAARDFAALERVSGGRLGVTLLDTASGRRTGHRQDERFPMCSTFKSMLAAAVLGKADTGKLSLDSRIAVRAGDMLPHAPVTGRHVGKDLTIRDLCRATMVTRNNPAANLLLGAVGGPAAVTAFLRGHGDTVTRTDRTEPSMNEFAVGDPRDTTSPAAMAASLQRFVLGDALSVKSRAQLADWLIDNETGDSTLRAGLGARWRVGDKTGSNGTDTRNDIAVLWPVQGGSPWVLAAYLQGASVGSAQRDAVLARVGALADALIG